MKTQNTTQFDITTLTTPLSNRANKYDRNATICGDLKNFESYQYWTGRKDIMNNVLDMVADPEQTLEMIIVKIKGTLPMMENQIEVCANHNNRTSMQYYYGERDGSKEILKLISDMQPAKSMYQ
jgi:hypothetical protein